jgi:predicted SnoaL-like aldol condensation-catalyzing enzyme
MRVFLPFAAFSIAFALAFPACAGTAENKAVVLGYETTIFDKHNVKEALEKYVAPDYVQHSPEVPPGKDGLAARMGGPDSVIFQPNRHHDIVKVVAEGDEVVTFAHSYKEGERGVAVVDWFRLKGGKIVEHWDILQQVPEKSLAGGSMFDVMGK